MARIPSPRDATVETAVSNRRRVIEVAVDNSGAQMSRTGSAVMEVLNRARDQQIENEVASTEMRTRRDLDQLRVDVENAPVGKDGAEPDIPALWDEGAQRIREQSLSGLSAPMARRAWEQRADALLTQERSSIVQLQQRRTVERARAGLLTTISEAQTTLVDENATPEARAQSLQTIETMVNRAVSRRTIAADDGARMIAGARANAAEFERERGMRARAQGEEDRIWTESGGDYGTALEMARDIEEPGLRDMVEDRVTTRASRQRSAESEATQNAMGRAYAHLERGGSIEGLPRGDRDVITRAGMMDTLRNYVRARAGGADGESWTQMTRQSELIRARMEGVAADPDLARVFARVDLGAALSAEDARALGVPEGTVIANGMMPADLNALVQRQREMRGEVPVGNTTQTIVDRAFNATIAVARRRALALGVNVTYSGTGTNNEANENRQRRAQFESYVMFEVRAYVEANSRPPMPADMDRIAQDALRESSRPGMFGRADRGYRFEAGGEGQARRVPYVNIPEWQVRRLVRVWAQSHDEAPTRQDIEEMYMHDLAGRDAPE